MDSRLRGNDGGGLDCLAAPAASPSGRYACQNGCPDVWSCIRGNTLFRHSREGGNLFFCCTKLKLKNYLL